MKPGYLIVADQFIAITGNMIDHCLRIPFAVGEKLVKIPGFGVRVNLGHPVHVFTQTACIRPLVYCLAFSVTTWR